MRHVFKAHRNATPDDAEKYEVPAGGQYLALFYFDAPWASDVQLLEARSILDNPKVVHHWALYAVNNPRVRDGEILGGPDSFYTFAHGGSDLVFSAGPGASDLVMPAGVGMRIPSGPNTAFALEVHYFNASEQAERDATAIEACFTTKRRPEEAATHMLGRVTFELPPHQRTEITSTCKPARLHKPVHLVSVNPHMHRRGIQAKLVVERAGGERVTILDAPYRFDEQRSHVLGLDSPTGDIVLQPGDSLTTTCTFDNMEDAVVRSGDLDADEMCGMMIMAWPAGHLNNGQLLGALFGMSDEMTCVEL